MKAKLGAAFLLIPFLFAGIIPTAHAAVTYTLINKSEARASILLWEHHFLWKDGAENLYVDPGGKNSRSISSGLCCAQVDIDYYTPTWNNGTYSWDGGVEHVQEIHQFYFWDCNNHTVTIYKAKDPEWQCDPLVVYGRKVGCRNRDSQPAGGTRRYQWKLE